MSGDRPPEEVRPEGLESTGIKYRFVDVGQSEFVVALCPCGRPASFLVWRPTGERFAWCDGHIPPEVWAEVAPTADPDL